MPSVFTIEGTTHRKRKRKSHKSKGLGSSMKMGECKVINTRGGKRRFCKVGKSKKAPTGYIFKAMK